MENQQGHKQTAAGNSIRLVLVLDQGKLRTLYWDAFSPKLDKRSNKVEVAGGVRWLEVASGAI
jgi:hypothetical protein